MKKVEAQCPGCGSPIIFDHINQFKSDENSSGHYDNKKCEDCQTKVKITITLEVIKQEPPFIPSPKDLMFMK